jgi:hypothetical protein
MRKTNRATESQVEGTTYPSKSVGGVACGLEPDGVGSICVLMGVATTTGGGTRRESKLLNSSGVATILSRVCSVRLALTIRSSPSVRLWVSDAHCGA